MKKSVLAIALAVLMAVSLLNVGAMAEGTGSGTADDPYTSVAAYNAGIADGEFNGKDVYLLIDNQSFTNGGFNLTNVQSWENPPMLHLTITNSKFTGNTAEDTSNPSFMYLPNCKELVIDNCNFDADSGLKYGINWNLIQITDATVRISNCTFNGIYQENAIKLNQRNGEGDMAEDIKPSTWENKPIAATIERAVIENCTINSPVPVILLGSAGKGESKGAAPSTGAFPVTIRNCKTNAGEPVNVFLAYNASESDADAIENAMQEIASGGQPSAEALALASKLVVTVDGSTSVSKTANGDLGKAEDFVASIGTDCYTSLQSAINAAEDNDTITLLKNVVLNSTLELDKNISLRLDMNGCNVTGNDVRAIWIKSGSLTIEGIGTVTSQAGDTEPKLGEDSSVIRVGDNTGSTRDVKLVIGEDVTILAPDTYGVTAFGSATNESVTVYGTIAATSSRSAISGNGTDTSTGTTIIVKPGAVLSASNYYAIYHPQAGRLVIEGGTITGQGGIQMCAGELEITGEPVITATNTMEHGTVDGNDGAVLDGAAVSIVNRPGYNGGTPEAVIEGGTFITTADEDAIQTYTWEKNNGTDYGESEWTEAPSNFIYGGTFSSSVAEYVASDLNYELNNNGTYSYYATSEEALADAEPGAEINGLGAAAATNYTITVVYGNGMYPSEYTVPAGTEYTLPNVTNSGYIFLGWRSGDNTYKAGEKVAITADTTFTAVWGNLPDVKPSEPETPETPVFPFYDVSARDWYYSAVKYVYEKGLMDGVDVGVFAPNDTLTRAMVWTIIARAEGVDTTGGATWYAKAQEWVTAKGISDGENPSAAITRQELVTMLYRLAGEPAVSGTITAPDASSVSTWAPSAMTWAMNIGLVEGDENGAVTPTATATRAQAAALIMRYLEA